MGFFLPIYWSVINSLSIANFILYVVLETEPINPETILSYANIENLTVNSASLPIALLYLTPSVLLDGQHILMTQGVSLKSAMIIYVDLLVDGAMFGPLDSYC
jgi:hypothetical protein